MVRHISWKTAVDPVKWMPAKSGWASTGSPTSRPAPGRKFTTPGGSPASSRSCRRCQPERTAVVAGFQSTTLPMMAGAVGRLAAMAVKLKGVTAKTNPSSGRCSTRFQIPGEETGCCP
jgi:hypothetical protein